MAPVASAPVLGALEATSAVVALAATGRADEAMRGMAAGTVDVILAVGTAVPISASDSDMARAITATTMAITMATVRTVTTHRPATTRTAGSASVHTIPALALISAMTVSATLA